MSTTILKSEPVHNSTDTPVVNPEALEKGVLKLRELDQQAQEITSLIRSKGKALIRLRFQQGRIVEALYQQYESVYGESLMQRLEQGTGVSRRLLWQAHQFYRLPELRGSELLLEQWIENRETERGSISWTYCRNYAAKQLSPHDPDKIQDEAERLERRSERLEQDAQDLQRRTTSPEAEGVTVQAQLVAQDTRAQLRQVEAKPQTPRSTEYLTFVRSLPCCVTGQPGAEAHHVEQGGVGMKGSDFSCIPLAPAVHRYVENQGHRAAETFYGFSVAEALIETMHRFLSGQEVKLPNDLQR